MTDKLIIMDEVRTPDGSIGRVSEFDEVDGHTLMKVWFGIRWAWYKAEDLTHV